MTAKWVKFETNWQNWKYCDIIIWFKQTCTVFENMKNKKNKQNINENWD